MDEKHVIAGRYRLEERIGRGGMGVVWRGTDLQLGRSVAMKQSRAPADRADHDQMAREARNTARLRHEHVVPLHDMVLDDDGHPWLVMEFVGFPGPGSTGLPSPDRASPTLAHLVADRPLAPRRAARIGAQIAEALAEAHRHGIVHRDVKPQNVLFRRLERDGVRDHALLGDFGIARHADATLTDSGATGTPAYMAPEVAAGREATPASDVFSLGSTLYTAVTGSPPFGSNGHPRAIMRLVEACAVVVPPSAGPLREVLERLLQKDPDARPTAFEAAQLLRAVAGEPPLPPSDGRKPVPWAVVAVVAGVVVAVVAAVVVFVPRGGENGAAGAAGADAPPPAAPAVATTALGDLETADPCGLADAGVLRPYGDTRLETTWGGFERCDVFVEPAPGDEVDVKIEFYGPSDPDGPEPETAEDVGIGRLVRGKDDGDDCTRTLLLPDGNELDVTAEDGQPHANRCGMAEAAVQHAIEVLQRGEAPRRAPFAPNSLGLLDACRLPGDTALSRIPGLDPTTADPGFGAWNCDWDGPADDIRAELRFDRGAHFTARDGEPTQVGDREARVEAPGYQPDGCTVKIAHRPYRAANGGTEYEVVLVSVAGATGPPEQFCTPATELARAVVAALPPA